MMIPASTARRYAFHCNDNLPSPQCASHQIQIGSSWCQFGCRRSKHRSNSHYFTRNSRANFTAIRPKPILDCLTLSSTNRAVIAVIVLILLIAGGIGFYFYRNRTGEPTNGGDSDGPYSATAAITPWNYSCRSSRSAERTACGRARCRLCRCSGVARVEEFASRGTARSNLARTRSRSGI